MDQKTQIRRHYSIYRAYKELFSSATGRKVLHDLMKQFCALDTTIEKRASGHPIDVNAMIFNEGQRNVVIYILHKLKMDVGHMEQLIGEIHADSRSYHSER